MENKKKTFKTFRGWCREAMKRPDRDYDFHDFDSSKWQIANSITHYIGESREETIVRLQLERIQYDDSTYRNDNEEFIIQMLDTSLTELLAIPPKSPLDTRIASHEERLRQKKIQLENSLLAAEKKFQEIRQQIIEDASRLTDFSPRQLEQAINSAREDVRVLTFTCRMLAKEKLDVGSPLYDL